MNFPKTFLACFVGLTLHGTAVAQIYESKDADGNPVFTDQPSAGAEQVKLPQTNTADAVQEMAGEQAEKAPAMEKMKGEQADAVQEGDPDYYYAGGNAKEKEELERREQEERLRNAAGDTMPGGAEAKVRERVETIAPHGKAPVRPAFHKR